MVIVAATAAAMARRERRLLNPGLTIGVPPSTTRVLDGDPIPTRTSEGNQRGIAR
jgi:hypothetical protein